MVGTAAPDVPDVPRWATCIDPLINLFLKAKVLAESNCVARVMPVVPDIASVIVGYSYRMLIVPASKVSVPLTVVMRTRSRVPAKALELLPILLTPALFT